MKLSYLVITYSLILLVQSCSFNTGRYQQRHDSKPTRLPTQAELQNPLPRFEKKSRGGNKQYYQVRGNTYQVLKSAKDFEETGIASWYGNKFHGHLTSNGETYDMFAMSAAHKNLPIPTYVNVTNLANNKTVIVRVNDRGPFHQKRIIDLSYSAAYKLDMLKTGIANVKVEAITDFTQYDKSSSINITPSSTTLATRQENPQKQSLPTIEITNHQPTVYIQVLATRDQKLAQNTAAALTSLYQQNVIFPEKEGIYRVQIGPFKNAEDISTLITALKQSGYESAYRRKILH